MKYQRFNLRIPVDLYEQVMTKAEKTSKSMNAEIIYRLRDSLELKSRENEKFQVKLASLHEVREAINEEFSKHFQPN